MVCAGWARMGAGCWVVVLSVVVVLELGVGDCASSTHPASALVPARRVRAKPRRIFLLAILTVLFLIGGIGGHVSGGSCNRQWRRPGNRGRFALRYGAVRDSVGCLMQGLRISVSILVFFSCRDAQCARRVEALRVAQRPVGELAASQRAVLTLSSWSEKPFAQGLARQ